MAPLTTLVRGKIKGHGLSQRRKNCARPPHDDSRIIILKRFETHEEALLHERYMIYIYGRKDYCELVFLHNHSEGGEGTLGYKMTDDG